MNNLKEKLSYLKDSLVDKKNEFKNFCIEHKVEIICGIISAGSISYAILSQHYNKETTQKLINDNNELKKQIYEQENKIIGLQNLCYLKDLFYKKAISDDLRHGGSFGAREMAHLRWEYKYD